MCIRDNAWPACRPTAIFVIASLLLAPKVLAGDATYYATGQVLELTATDQKLEGAVDKLFSEAFSDRGAPPPPLSLEDCKAAVSVQQTYESCLRDGLPKVAIRVDDADRLQQCVGDYFADLSTGSAGSGVSGDGSFLIPLMDTSADVMRVRPSISAGSQRNPNATYLESAPRRQMPQTRWTQANIAIVDTGIHPYWRESGRLNIVCAADFDGLGSVDEIACEQRQMPAEGERSEVRYRGHGTLMAFVAAGLPAYTSDKDGVEQPDSRGVAPGAGIYDLRVCGTRRNGSPKCSRKAVMDALRWIIRQNQGLSESDPMRIHVVNISLADYSTHDPGGTTEFSKLVDRVTREANALVVAGLGNAAGNPAISPMHGTTCNAPPAAARTAISVAGSHWGVGKDPNDRSAYGDTTGSYLCGANGKPDIAAPYASSVFLDLSKSGHGTSFSVAKVSGLAAAIIGRGKNPGPAALRRAIVESAYTGFTGWTASNVCQQSPEQHRWHPAFGNGLIDASQAANSNGD